MTTGGEAVVQTSRLVLRRLDASDAPFILELLNEPSFIRYIGDKGVRTIEDAVRYIDGQIASYDRFGFGLFLAALREPVSPIGICGLVRRDTLEDPDIGFAFMPAFWSRGLAFESAAAVVAHAARDLRIPRLIAIADADNARSIRLLEKLGLRFDRMIRLNPEGAELKLLSIQLEVSALESPAECPG